MKFYVGTTKVEHEEFDFSLATVFKEKDREGMLPLFEALIDAEYWTETSLVELTSHMELYTGMTPFDIKYLSGLCEYVEEHDNGVEYLFFNIIDMPVLMVTFDNFTSLFIESKNVNRFITALSGQRRKRKR
ncbi:hypothetical protein SHAb15599_00114 [Acinetobacter phage SH-Ab 15599]|nr:hypothetical protein SHAb15599_00114 [Acinetobacter phage SH-Ab 15599]